MIRNQHLAWAKARALAYVDAGELGNALSSMLSDLGRQGGQLYTADYLTAQTMLAQALVRSGNATGMRRWIESFR